VSAEYVSLNMCHWIRVTEYVSAEYVSLNMCQVNMCHWICVTEYVSLNYICSYSAHRILVGLKLTSTHAVGKLIITPHKISV